MSVDNDWIRRAKYDCDALEHLKHHYQPFIAARILLHMGFWRPEYMETGHEALEEAVHSYNSDKGSFIGHFRGILKHRLIDLRRRERVDKVVPSSSLSEAHHMHAINTASIEAHREQMEAQRRREEIEHFRNDLEDIGLTLKEVAESSPKHSITRQICRKACRHLLQQPELLEKACRGRIPAKELSDVLDVSLKTLERHRKYLVACAVALAGEYHCIIDYILDGEGNP